MVDAISSVSTVGEIMQVMAPNLGGTIPTSGGAEYLQWLLAIQMKYEEASRRGFWRRLLTKDILPLRTGDTEVTLPDRFQRTNGLYILEVEGVDLADPFRIPDEQTATVQMINDPEDSEFGKWKVIFTTPIVSDYDATIWYFSNPPKPTESTDIVLLPGDMIAFGAMTEIFRSKNLPGSVDDARQEYENRLSTYLAMEMIPARNELLTFVTNPKRIDYHKKAKLQYLTRTDRLGRIY